MLKSIAKLAGLAGALALTTSVASARDLVINFDDLNPGPKKGFEDAVEAFKAAHPDINVIVKTIRIVKHTRPPSGTS